MTPLWSNSFTFVEMEITFRRYEIAYSVVVKILQCLWIGSELAVA
jgi:hypothetical protein